MVQVVLTGLLVIRPGRFLLAGKDHLGGLLARLVGPDVPIAERRVAAHASGLEPRMAVRRMVGDEVDDHAQATVARHANEAREVAERTEVLVDAVVVGDA